jgi:hypothetical protein
MPNVAVMLILILAVISVVMAALWDRSAAMFLILFTIWLTIFLNAKWPM